MVTNCVIVHFASFPGNDLFFTFAEFVGVSRCHCHIVVSIHHVRNDLHVSRRCRVTALVRLKETIEGTDWCKLRAPLGVKTAPLLSERNNTRLVTAVISVTANDSVTISF